MGCARILSRIFAPEFSAVQGSATPVQSLGPLGAVQLGYQESHLLWELQVLEVNHASPNVTAIIQWEASSLVVN